MMIKTTLALLSVAACASWSSSVVLATQDATITHRTADGKSHVVKPHMKFTTTPLGEQCAYDLTKDPSLYPCKERGVCVRLNATYGECFTQEQAAKIQEELDGSDDSDSSDASEDASESGSGSDSADVDVGDEEDEEDEEAVDEEGEEDDEEDDVVIVQTPPPMRSVNH